MKLYFNILFLWLFIAPINLFGQTAKIDSLTALLKSAQESDQFEILHELHVNTYRNNTQKSYEYAIQSIHLAKKLETLKPLPRAYQDLAITFMFFSEFDSSLFYFEKAKELAIQLDDKHAIASCTRSIGSVYWYKNQLDKTLEYYKQSLKDFRELGDSQQVSTCVANLGTAYYALGDYEKSINYYKQSYGLVDKEKFPGEAADCLNDIGSIYQEWGNQDKALEYFIQSLKTNEANNNTRGIAANLENIGNVYYSQENYRKALEYYKRELKIYQNLNTTIDAAFTLIPVGNVYIKMNKPDTALILFKKALKDFEKLDHQKGKAVVLKNIGDIYNNQQRYTQSIPYYEKSVKLAKEIQDNKSLSEAYSALGIANYYIHNYTKALSFLIESSKIAYEGNFINILKDDYYYLAEIQEKLGNKDDQIYYLKKYVQTKDSILTIERQKQVSELQAKYETEKKEQQIELLNKVKEVNENKIIVQRTINYSIIIILILLAIGTFLLFRRFKEKQRINDLLSQKNKEIQDKQTEIEQQNKKLEEQADKLSELDELKTRFFTNISHEFRTPLTLIIGPLEQLLQKVKEPDSKSSLNLMLRNANKLLDLINQLLEISKIERGNVKLKFHKDDIEKEAHYITEMFSSMAADKKLKLEFKSDNSDFEGYIDKEKFHKIISNLLSNAFKHTAKGKISLELKKSSTPGKIQILVSDTGVGIKKDKLPYIFDRFYQVDTNENEETAGTGIGLSFIKELIYLYKGEITAQSEPNKGTKFIIELPITLDFFTENEYEIISSDVNDIKHTQISADSGSDQNYIEDKKDKEIVLVVEDHSDLRGFIVQNLIGDYQVLEAANGEEGIEKALNHIPNLIITDIMMPKVSGIELTKTLKSDQSTSHIPVIMLTAKSSIESKIEGLETEADDYLTKPFNITELQLRIRNLIKSRKKLQEKYNKSITVNPSEITTTSVDEKFLSKLLNAVEDNMNNSQLSVEMLCDIVGMSRANIHKKLKSLVNQSATEFINSIRLKRAAQLIQQNAGNVSEIAYDVGYNNLSYFSRAFKKHFNMTPKEMMEKRNN